MIQRDECGCEYRLTPTGVERIETCLEHEEGEDRDG